MASGVAVLILWLGLLCGCAGKASHISGDAGLTTDHGTSGHGGTSDGGSGKITNRASADAEDDAGSTTADTPDADETTVDGICASYPSTTIAAIRNPAAPGCYELAHVGLVARTDNPAEPRVYLQDKGAGDYSAILAKCSLTAKHACSPAVATQIQGLYDTFDDGAQISVRGYYQHRPAIGFEQFYIEAIGDDGTTLPRPPPIDLTVADLERDARTSAKWFQRANVAVPAQDPLAVYDFAPADLYESTSCPAYAGFALISQSAGAAVASACMGMTSPAAQPADPREVLIGRQFFRQLLFSTDCACAGIKLQYMVNPAQTVIGTMRGYLILEQDREGTQGFQVFEAAADQVFPLK